MKGHRCSCRSLGLLVVYSRGCLCHAIKFFQLPKLDNFGTKGFPKDNEKISSSKRLPALGYDLETTGLAIQH